MRKQVLMFIASILVVAGIVMISLLQSHAQKSSRSKTKEDATPVQEGVMSEKQKEQSKLYIDYKGPKKLADLLNQQSDSANETTVTAMPGLPELSPVGELSTPETFLQNLAAKSDAIVVGTIASKSSQLTENGTFIFTDYDVAVKEVLKDNKANTIQPQSIIEVTRPGGRVLLQGRAITARDKNFKPLEIGEPYLLFLKYVPTTNSYHAVSDKGSFKLTGNKVEPLTEAPDTLRIDKDATSFISDVRAAIAASGYE